MSAVVYNADGNSGANKFNAGLSWGSGIINAQQLEYSATCGGSNKVILSADKVSEDSYYNATHTTGAGYVPPKTTANYPLAIDESVHVGPLTYDSEDDMEEERRLAYVAITRAKKRLYLTNARQRMLFGQTQHNVTSRFMREIGSELVEKHDNAAAMKQQMESSDKSVTEVHSATLQQQLARSKKSTGAPKEAVEYTAGEKVSHSIFGEGVIVSVKPMANDFMLEIAFDKVGTKKIMATYAKLKKL